MDSYELRAITVESIAGYRSLVLRWNIWPRTYSLNWSFKMPFPFRKCPIWLPKELSLFRKCSQLIYYVQHLACLLLTCGSSRTTQKWCGNKKSLAWRNNPRLGELIRNLSTYSLPVLLLFQYYKSLWSVSSKGKLLNILWKKCVLYSGLKMRFVF